MQCIKSVFPSTLVKICTICHRFLSPTRPRLRCTGICREYYHHRCLSFDYGSFGTMCAALNIDWSCLKCTAARAHILGAPLPGWSRRRRSFQSDPKRLSYINIDSRLKASSHAKKSKYKSEADLFGSVTSKHEAKEEPSTSKDSEREINVTQEAEDSQKDSSEHKKTSDTVRGGSKAKRERVSIDKESHSSQTEKISSSEQRSLLIETKQNDMEVKQEQSDSKQTSASASLESSAASSSRRTSKSDQRSGKKSKSREEKSDIKISAKKSETNGRKDTEKIKDLKSNDNTDKAAKEVKEARISDVESKPTEGASTNKELKDGAPTSGRFFETIMKEVLDYRRTQDGLVNSIMFITSAFYDLSTIMGVMKQNSEDIHKLKEENTYLRTEIKDICTKLESMEQDLTSDLRSKKFLEDSDENIIMNITTKIRNTIDIQDEQ